MPARDRSPAPTSARSAALALVALLLAALAAPPTAGADAAGDRAPWGFRRVDVPSYTVGSRPVIAAHALTRDPGDRFARRAGHGWFRVLASGTNRDRNTRLVLYPPEARPSVDQTSCATWTDQSGGTTQQGVALRVRHRGERWQAITVTKNIWFGASWNFNVHTWDSTDHGVWRLRGRILLGAELGGNGSPVPLPWRVCARAEGPLITLKVWPTAEAEPTWDDPLHTGTVAVPDAWVYSGRAGWYLGHLEAGATAGFLDTATSGRPLAAALR